MCDKHIELVIELLDLRSFGDLVPSSQLSSSLSIWGNDPPRQNNGIALFVAFVFAFEVLVADVDDVAIGVDVVVGGVNSGG